MNFCRLWLEHPKPKIDPFGSHLVSRTCITHPLAHRPSNPPLLPLPPSGGIFMPIMKFLAKSSGSEPDKDRKKLGSFLVQAQFQTSTQSSALFVTAAAQNLLCLKLAAELGAPIPDPWMTWFKGALVPALVGLITIPWLIYKLEPPGKGTHGCRWQLTRTCHVVVAAPCGARGVIAFAPLLQPARRQGL